MQSGQNPAFSNIDEYYYHEAIQHVNVIRNFFDQEFGPENILTAESNFAFGLILLKTGDYNSCYENLQKALMIFQNQLGEFDVKTKEVSNLLNQLDQTMQ